MTTDPRPDDRLDDALAMIAALGPAPGSCWRHRKGGVYRVVCCALREEDCRPLVVYREERPAGMPQGVLVWARPLNEFRERFALVAPGEKPCA